MKKLRLLPALCLLACTSVISVKASIPSTDFSNIQKQEIINISEFKKIYIVKAGDAADLMEAIQEANTTNKSITATRYYIFLPQGTYDLGETCLTTIAGHNISLIGQNMDKTIIKNTPKIENEGIGKTATILIKGQNTYLQDITLQDALDYYGNGAKTGRGVALQDKGNRTICKNVRLLSYQDTYYSNGKGQYYWEGGDIHGTVDFICGGGDVFFNGTQITVEKRTASGMGECTITAPATDPANKGYIFNCCTIVSLAEAYNYGRAWGGKPRAAFINCVLRDSRLISERWRTAGMNTFADKFVEYNTKDPNGNVISPASNILTFMHKTGSNKIETIIDASQASTYSLTNTFTNWKPDQLAAQINIKSLKAKGMKIKFKANKAIAYAIYKDSELKAIVSGSSYTAPTGGVYSVRAINAMGGQGPKTTITVK
jgi:pectin methylesterase-like acyl-CoA thioesterase